jgi:hypothetical protein
MISRGRWTFFFFVGFIYTYLTEFRLGPCVRMRAMKRNGGNVSNGQLREIGKKRRRKKWLVKCDQAKGVLAWLICQCVCVSDHLSNAIWRVWTRNMKKRTHTLVNPKGWGTKNISKERYFISLNYPEKKD